MLYHLFKYLETEFGLSGSSLFEFLTFRAALAIIISLIISWLFGGKLIKFLQGQQVKETVRDLGLAGEKQKQGTPTMGGLIILTAILIPVLLLGDLSNIYIQLMIFVTISLGTVGFVDDYIKVFKKDKGGLAARSKLIGQFFVGTVVALTLWLHPQIVVRQDITDNLDKQFQRESNRFMTFDQQGETRIMVDYRDPVTTIPFVKNTEFNYGSLLGFLGENGRNMGWLLYLPIVILILVFISNGANLTDGMDGLATGVSAIMVVTLGIFAYVSGNSIVSDYLNILYLPRAGELLVFSAAFIGACIGFLWYNAYPAQVFMGDTGSLAIGGIIAALAIVIRKEALIPILCGVFIIENLSVMIQVSYFKYTKRKYGEGRRIFKMAPLHHHFQKQGHHESKIVSRFWIISILLAVLTFIITLKIR